MKEKLMMQFVQDHELIEIVCAPNGKFFNHYGVRNGHASSVAGSFETLEQAESMVRRHRPRAVKIQ